MLQFLWKWPRDPLHPIEVLFPHEFLCLQIISFYVFLQTAESTGLLAVSLHHLIPENIVFLAISFLLCPFVAIFPFSFHIFAGFTWNFNLKVTKASMFGVVKTNLPPVTMNRPRGCKRCELLTSRSPRPRCRQTRHTRRRTRPGCCHCTWHHWHSTGSTVQEERVES